MSYLQRAWVQSPVPMEQLLYPSSRDLMPPCVLPRTRHAHIHIEKHSDKTDIRKSLKNKHLKKTLSVMSLPGLSYNGKRNSQSLENRKGLVSRNGSLVFLVGLRNNRI